MMERITSRQNPLLTHLKKLLSSRSYRYECRQFAADGVKLLQEALRWGAKINTVIVSREDIDAKLPGGVRFVNIPADVMNSVSQMEAPQGLIFICDMPETAPLQVPSPCLILDGLQDPGNVGTILRTADALDVPVILSSGCADIYNPKTVRATMGAIFRMRLQCAEKEEIISACKAAGIPLLATALSDRAVSLCETELQGAMVIGSEGKGVCREYLDAADKEIIIPMSERCESLNAAVAATIAMWEMRKG